MVSRPSPPSSHGWAASTGVELSGSAFFIPLAQRQAQPREIRGTRIQIGRSGQHKHIACEGRDTSRRADGCRHQPRRLADILLTKFGMDAGAMFDAKYLRECLDYSPETGVFTWRERPREHFKTCGDWKRWNACFAATRAGSHDPRGREKISIGRRLYWAHRLAWLHMTGEWPKHEIDHRDCDKSNNRFANLREATRSENERNKKILSRNTSGVKGVSWHKRDKKWRVTIRDGSEKILVGSFDADRLDDAASAYERAAKELHGEFARV
jgi:hypothetical protein